MAKAGMRRPEPEEPNGKKNHEPPVPEIQGKAKADHKKANDAE